MIHNKTTTPESTPMPHRSPHGRPGTLHTGPQLVVPSGRKSAHKPSHQPTNLREPVTVAELQKRADIVELRSWRPKSSTGGDAA